MPKVQTPHLNNWLRTFKNVGSTIGRASIDALQQQVPTISSVTTSATDVIRESRDFINRTRSQLSVQLNTLDRTKLANNAKSILDSAFNDMKNGTFSIDKLGDSSYDSIDDFDASISDSDIDISDPTSVALYESKKNTAIIGKVIAEGNSASIEGMRQMTATLANVNMKTANAAVTKLTNIALLGINQTNSQLMGVNSRLDQVNANLSAMIEFQNTTTLKAHQSAVEYYSTTTQMLDSMGKVLAEMQDFNNAQKQMNLPSGKSKNSFDLSYGFSLRDYADFVKKNFNNSSLGMITSMGKTVGGLMGGMGGMINPLEMALSTAIGWMIPSNVKKSLGRLDKVVNRSIDNMLLNIGDMSNSNDFFKMMIGEIFGKKRDTFKGINMGNFKKDFMGWNGIAQKTLVEVIPSYLSRIEAALTKKEARYYNMDTGKFMTESQVTDDFKKSFQSTIEYNMGEFTREFNKVLANANTSNSQKRSIQEYVNEMVYNDVMGKTDSTARRSSQASLRSMLQNANVGNNELRDLMMELADSVSKTQKQINEFTKSVEESTRGSIYRNIHNTHKKDVSDLYKMGDIFAGTSFTSSGQILSDLSDYEIQQHQREQAMQDQSKNFFRRLKDRFIPNRQRVPRGARLSGGIDRAANAIYDLSYGDRRVQGDGFTMSSPTSSSVQHRRLRVRPPHQNQTSNNQPLDMADYIYDSAGSTVVHGGATNIPNSEPSQRRRIRVRSHVQQQNRAIDDQISRMSSRTFDSAMSQSQSQINADMLNVNRIMNDQRNNDRRSSRINTEGATSRMSESADMGLGEDATIRENTNTLKSLVLGLHSHFLQPMVSGLFGKDGFFRNILKNEHIQKGINFLKEKLFDEKDGLFAPMVSGFKDQIDYLKYVITGKGYTNRNNETFADDRDNSVVGHLANGYDFIFKNTMKHIFGDDFASKDTFKKYFQWMDWKGKRDAKYSSIRENSATDEAVSNEQNSSADNKLSSKNGRTFSAKINTSSLPRVKSVRFNRKPATNSADIIDTYNVNEAIRENLLSASEEASAEIIESAHALSTTVLGEYSDETQSENIQRDASQSFSSKIKKHLPKSLAAGAVGALVGTSLGIHGTGLIGSLFLPAGPIGGALMGIGIEMLSRSEGFNKFLFGEKDEDGNRTNGLISNKTQQFIKKSLPLIVGGATIGALKNVFLGGITGSGGVGFLTGSLLPGGVIGGAILGIGLSLLKNNESFNRILFGEKDDDGKRIGGMFSKSMGGFGKVLEKSSGFIKGGLKGLGTGAFAGTVLSHAGILGAALTPAGPIGAAIAGLGVGIASQTDKFKEVLFGTEEFDEDGNSKGRLKNGLLYKVRNMLVINVFEPIKDKLVEKMEDFAYWAKDQIMYPFRLVFGPILDSLAGIKQNISDAIHDTFNNISKAVTDTLKKTINVMFSPLTKVFGFIGRSLLNTVSFGAKLALTPISAPLKLLQFATLRKRMPEYITKNRNMVENIGSIFSGVKEKWDNEDSDDIYGTGIVGNVKKFIGRAKDVKGGFEAASLAWDKAKTEQGDNHLNWRGVRREKRDDRINKRFMKKDRRSWKDINKLRREIIKENNNSEVRLTDEELEKYQKKFADLGINKDFISTNEDLNMLLYNRDDWKEKFKLTKNNMSAQEYTAKYGMKIQETEEQMNARKATTRYQEFMMEQFAPISKVFTKIAMQDSLKKHKNLSIKDIGSLNKQLKDAGLTWEEVGIEPGDLVDINNISDEDWNEYLSEIGKGGNSKKKKRKGFNQWFKNKYTEDGEEANTNEALVEVLSDVRESVQSSERMDAAQLADDVGAGTTELQKTTGKKFSTRMFSWIHRKKNEANESSQASGLKGVYDTTDEDANNEAVIDAEYTEVDDNEKKGILGTIGGFVSKVFGSLGNWFSDTSLWTKLGIGVGIAALFGDKLKGVTSKIGDLMTEHVIPFAKKAFGALGDWWNTHGKQFTNTVTNAIVNNMSSIVGNALKIGWSAFSTIGKKGINWLASFLPGNWVPFKDVDDSSTTWNSYESAANTGLYVQDNGDGTYSTPGERQIVNQDGTFSNIDRSQDLDTLAHFGFSYATNKTTRKLANATVKGVGKVAGWTTGLIPGGKVVKGAVKSGVATAKGVKSVFNAGKNAMKKAGQESAEAVIENGVKTSAKTAAKRAGAAVGETAAEQMAKKVGKETAEAVAKEASQSTIRNLIVEIGTKMKNVASKVADLMPANKFTKAIVKFIDDLVALVVKAAPDKLKSLASTVTEKVAKATGKSVSSAVVIIQAGFTAYDAISGALEAGYLFEIDEEYVTAGMRVISSLMKVLLGLGIGPWIDILIVIGSMLSGKDFKKIMATNFYNALPTVSDEAKEALKRAQIAREIEAENYNKINKTSLSVDAYTDLKKNNTGLFNKDKKNLKLEQYKATDAQINARMNTTVSSTSSKNNSTPADEVILFGPGQRRSSKSSGYGQSLTQSDSRWAKYKLGKFPDGSTSTMETGGCGPTALSMVSNSLGLGSTPLGMAQYAKSNGYLADGGATASLFTDGARRIGLSSSAVNKNTLRHSLESGSPIVLAGKSSESGPYTKAGHVIMASGFNSRTGKVIVNDPMYAGTRETSLSSLQNGMTHGWSYSVGYGRSNDMTIKQPVRSNINRRTLPFSTENAPSYAAVSTGQGTSSNTSMQYAAAANDPKKNISENNITTSTDTSDTTNKKRVSKRKMLSMLNKDGIIVPTAKERLRVMISDGPTKNKLLSTTADVKLQYEYGLKQNASGVLNFQTPTFYSGLTVGDIRALGNYDATIIADPATSLFGSVYRYYVKSNRYGSNSKIDVSVVKELVEDSRLTELIGGYGNNGDYEFKNGFPFFPTSDNRWGSIPWRNSNVKSRGSDLASLAMIASAFGENILPPNYIYNHWLQDNKHWWSSSDGIKVANVFREGGFNAMKSTQVDEKRLKVSELLSTNSIISALKQRKPVYMTGYKYDGSIFGGTTKASLVDTTDPDSYGSVVALYANDRSIAVNDPFTTNDAPYIFNTDALKDSVGIKNMSAIKHAYVVTDPNGNGLSQPIDISSKNAPKSKYQSIKDASGLEKIAALINNIVAVGSNLLSGFIDGTGYQSIMAETIDDDTADSAGIDMSDNAGFSENAINDRKVLTDTLKLFNYRDILTNSKLMDGINTPSLSISGNTILTHPKVLSKQLDEFNKTELKSKMINPYNFMNSFNEFKKTSSTSKMINPNNFITSFNEFKKTSSTSKVSNQSTLLNSQTSVLPLESTLSNPVPSGSVFNNTLGGSIGNGSRDIAIGYGKTSNLMLGNTGLPSLQNILTNPNTYSNKTSATQSNPAVRNLITSNSSLFNLKNVASTPYMLQKEQPRLANPLFLQNSNSTSNSTTNTGEMLVLTESTTNTASSQQNGLATLLNKLMAVASANISASMGEDYNTALQQYLNQNGSSENTTVSSIDASSLSGSTNAEKVWNYFTGLGYTKEATAGIMGNLYQESCMNPAAIQRNGRGPAAGIAQWENYNTKSLRWKDLDNFAKSRGTDWTDLATQLVFMHHELENELDYWFNKNNSSYEEFRNLKNVHQAAELFEVTFERSGKSKMAERLKFADAYYNQFSQSPPSATIDTSSIGNGRGSLNRNMSFYGPLRKTKAIGYGENWLGVVQATKQAIAAQQAGYSQSNHIRINVNNKELTVRTDCSGFVSACLQIYGVNVSTTSSGLVNMQSLEGFTKMNWPGWDNLVAGDILAKNGHTEIFARNENGSHYVYNCGSNSSCNNPNPTASSYSSYTVIWRPLEAGNLVDLSLLNTNTNTNSLLSLNSGNTTNNNAMYATSSSSSPLDNAILRIANIASSRVNSALSLTPTGYGSGSTLSKLVHSLDGTITSGYGKRKTVFGNEYHRGIDISATDGQSIYSPIDGTVVSTGNDVAGYGNYTVIQDSNGNNHLFAHMKNSSVYGVGSKVYQNDIIGEVGSTGKSTGNHLHYEIRKTGNKYSTLNPASYSGKNINVNSVNTIHNDNSSIGTGSRDLTSKEISDKLNIALNTKGVENKLDTLIEVMKTWADRDAKLSKSIQNINNTNNTTIAYGNGNGKKKTISNTMKKTSSTDLKSMSLATIHKAIAAK